MNGNMEVRGGKYSGDQQNLNVREEKQHNLRDIQKSKTRTVNTNSGVRGACVSKPTDITGNRSVVCNLFVWPRRHTLKHSHVWLFLWRAFKVNTDYGKESFRKFQELPK